MPSTSAPSEAQVWHYDGRSAARRSPLLRATGGGEFVLADRDGETGPWRFADLVSKGGGEFGLKRLPGWRIGFAEAPPGEIAALLPRERRYGGVIDRIGLWPAVVAFALLAAGAIYLVATTPAAVAKLVPRETEARLGALMVGDFGGRTCDTPEGDAALAAMIARLGPAARHADIRVANIPIVNAITLPGGHIVLFDGLIDKAASPDEVAGVLAHELGHVEHRDVVESLVRQLGLSVLLGGLDGNVGGYTQALLAAGYSRAAESRADAFAMDALRDARISPLATAAFFDRLAQAEVKAGRAATMLGYLSTHPMSSDRKAKFAASAGKAAHTPVLDAAQWRALRQMCKLDPDVSRTEFRF
jgi:Zn-dependent protease with chaperone function